MGQWARCCFQSWLLEILALGAVHVAGQTAQVGAAAAAAEAAAAAGLGCDVAAFLLTAVLQQVLMPPPSPPAAAAAAAAAALDADAGRWKHAEVHQG